MSDIKKLESLREDLVSKGLSSLSFLQRLGHLTNYFEEILEHYNKNVFEVYLTEHFEDYLHIMKNFD